MVRRRRIIYRKCSFGHRGSFRVNGIVPGPPEGSRGSTGWGHPSRRAPWAEVGREPAHSGLVCPPLGPPMRLGLGTLGEGHLHLPWGALLPLAAAPLGDPIS